MTNNSYGYGKNTKHYACFEIAISKEDLVVMGGCEILEKKTKNGYGYGYGKDGYPQYPQYPQYPDTGNGYPPPYPEGGYVEEFVRSNGILRCDQEWRVDFNWRVSGPLTRLLECGFWKSIVYFESMGGNETDFRLEETTEDEGEPDREYRREINVKPFSLKPGAYRLVASLQYHFENGAAGPIVGFEDVGIINMYDYKKSGITTPPVTTLPVDEAPAKEDPAKNPNLPEFVK